MPGDIVVIKVGTSSLVDTATRKVQVSSIARVAEVSSILISKGFRPIIVSSGAVGLGCARLGLLERPAHVAGKQAAAAVGQGKLMSVSVCSLPAFLYGHAFFRGIYNPPHSHATSFF